MPPFGVPSFNSSGVLPPFVGGDPTIPDNLSPYPVTTLDVANKMASSARRKDILRGYLTLRAKLHTLGFISGFQWIDGSFCENIENTENRDPGDIDIVTFFNRPAGKSAQDYLNIRNNNTDLFFPHNAKINYLCDAYYVDMTISSKESCVDQAKYWFGLFSHKRVTSLWKGMLRVELGTISEDAAALLRCS